jgi:hypothetical protein
MCFRAEDEDENPINVILHRKWVSAIIVNVVNY